ncbi:MAG: hypothetical protein ACHP9T_14565, partial [Caulobacterales bacterium]
MPEERLAAAALSDAPVPAPPAASLGLAFLGRLVFEGDRLAAVWEGLVAQLTADPSDAGAMLDLSTLVQMRGDREQGLALQAAALAQCRCYRTTHGTGRGLRVLAFMTPGDLMANTPLDFLLEGSEVELTTWYVDGAAPSPAEVPEHDVAFLAISQADDGSAALAHLAGAVGAGPPRAGWGGGFRPARRCPPGGARAPPAPARWASAAEPSSAWLIARKA